MKIEHLYLREDVGSPDPMQKALPSGAPQLTGQGINPDGTPGPVYEAWRVLEEKLAKPIKVADTVNYRGQQATKESVPPVKLAREVITIHRKHSDQEPHDKNCVIYFIITQYSEVEGPGGADRLNHFDSRDANTSKINPQGKKELPKRPAEYIKSELVRMLGDKPEVLAFYNNAYAEIKPLYRDRAKKSPGQTASRLNPHKKDVQYPPWFRDFATEKKDTLSTSKASHDTDAKFIFETLVAIDPPVPPPVDDPNAPELSETPSATALYSQLDILNRKISPIAEPAIRELGGRWLELARAVKSYKDDLVRDIRVPVDNANLEAAQIEAEAKLKESSFAPLMAGSGFNKSEKIRQVAKEILDAKWAEYVSANGLEEKIAQRQNKIANRLIERWVALRTETDQLIGKIAATPRRGWNTTYYVVRNNAPDMVLNLIGKGSQRMADHPDLARVLPKPHNEFFSIEEVGADTPEGRRTQELQRMKPSDTPDVPREVKPDIEPFSKVSHPKYGMGTVASIMHAGEPAERVLNPGDVVKVHFAGHTDKYGRPVVLNILANYLTLAGQ